MYTLIEYPSGVIVEAVVLSSGLNLLRIAMAGFQDVLELTASGNDWVTEEGQKVAVVFLQGDACEAVAVVPSARKLPARAAGSWATES
jgi:hypothetical protein